MRNSIMKMTPSRHRVSRSGSRALFTKTARKIQSINIRPPSSRGGIRL